MKTKNHVWVVEIKFADAKNPRWMPKAGMAWLTKEEAEEKAVVEAERNLIDAFRVVKYVAG